MSSDGGECRFSSFHLAPPAAPHPSRARGRANRLTRARQGHTEAEPAIVRVTDSIEVGHHTVVARCLRIGELAHRAGRPRSRTAKRAKPSTPSPQLLNPGAVEHHGLGRAASRAAPRARESGSKQVNAGLFRRAISAVAGTTDRHPTRNPAQSAATILGPPRCRRVSCRSNAAAVPIVARPPRSSRGAYPRRRHHRGRPPHGGCSLPTGASPSSRTGPVDLAPASQSERSHQPLHRNC